MYDDFQVSVNGNILPDSFKPEEFQFIFPNDYDGKEKHNTQIGENAFIGSGTLIVSPIDIGVNAKTGAGSVVTHNIPANTLVYGVPAREIKKDDSKDQA